MKAQAESWVRQGRELDLQEEPEKAERCCLRALGIYEQLLEQTGSRAYAQAAEQVCTTLADLAMQQGNMHGADRYYVKSLGFQQGKR